MRYQVVRIGCENDLLVPDYEYYIWCIDTLKIIDRKTGEVIYEK